jgi:cysteine synthase B
MVETETAFETARRIARYEGISAGMSSGAALYAAIETAAKVRSGRIAVIFPDRGEKYLSTALFE